MTTLPIDQLDSIAASLKEGAAKLADHLRQQAAITDELRRSADDAEAAGFTDFAAIFREMAARLGSASRNHGKEAAAARRRGRPPKTADDQPATG